MNIAVITGASSGIGKEFAAQLDDYGLDELWLIARSEDKLLELKQCLTTPCKILAIDLTKQSGIDRYAAELKEHMPSIYYLVNDSGFGKLGRYNEMCHQDIVDMIDLNAKAIVLLSMHSIPYMPEGSCMIQMSSAAAFNPLPNFNVYAATKAFVYHYARGLRVELRNKLIGVTVVCPGWVDTNFLDVAECNCTVNRPIKFLPMAKAKDVVEKALCDADKDRAVSVYGIHTKLHKLASKILPDCILIAKWMCMQINKN